LRPGNLRCAEAATEISTSINPSKAIFFISGIFKRITMYLRNKTGKKQPGLMADRPFLKTKKLVPV
jgi:hypothetical protein